MGRRAKGFSCGEADRLELRGSIAAGRRRDDLPIGPRSFSVVAMGRRGTRSPSGWERGQKTRCRSGATDLRGLAKGLEDGPRPGRPERCVGPREKALAMLETPPPKGRAAWDGSSLAEAVGAKKSGAYALGKDGVRLRRTRGWRLGADPDFAAKAADVIGLYPRPPARALALSADEKPGIQALSRTTGYVQTSSGKIVRGLKSAYRRNGALDLFAALNVATGEVRKETTKTKTRVDFRAFMDEVVKDLSCDREIHLTLDNYATHEKNDDWLKAHPNVTFHFTPTSASWLDQIEIWFGILGRKALKGAGSNSTHELAQAIDDFCDAWRENARPFVWRKREVRGSRIRNTVVNLMEWTLAHDMSRFRRPTIRPVGWRPFGEFEMRRTEALQGVRMRRAASLSCSVAIAGALAGGPAAPRARRSQKRRRKPDVRRPIGQPGDWRAQ